MREADLTTELARGAVMQVLPDELPLFDETAHGFFTDPDSVLGGARRDEPLGFGLEMALMTPYVLAAAAAVAKFVVGMVADEVKEESKPQVTRLVNRLWHLDGSGHEEDPAPVDEAFAQRVRGIAYDRASVLGLSDGESALLADAIVGALTVPTQDPR